MIGALIGLGAGVASGLAGVGGGVIMIPAMTELLGLSQQTAQGTSLFAIIFTSVAGTSINLRNRWVDLRAAAVIGLVGVIAVQVGSKLALQLDQQLLRRLFGGLVLFSGIRMFYRLARAERNQPAN